MGFDKETGYYTTREILGYGCKYNVVLSPDRGIGKTYGYKHAIMERPEITMLLYRQKPDMFHAIGNWLDDLTLKGPVEKRMDPARFRWDGDKDTGYQLYLDDNLKCYFRAISEVNNIKHETFRDETAWVIHDEFIPLLERKIPGVDSIGEAIEVIVKTIEHDSVHGRKEKGLKPVRVLMYANPFRLDSPILSYFGVNALIGYGVHRGTKPDVAWELIPPRPGDTQGQISDVNRRNRMFEASAFVEDVPKGAEPFASIRMRDKYFTIYRRGQNGIHWVKTCARHANLSGRLRRYGTLDGMRPDEISLESVPMFTKGLETEMQRGLLRYDDLNTKYDFMERLMEL